MVELCVGWIEVGDDGRKPCSIANSWKVGVCSSRCMPDDVRSGKFAGSVSMILWIRAGGKFDMNVLRVSSSSVVVGDCIMDGYVDGWMVIL